MPKILHIITGLNNGGAEAVLYRLCSADTQSQHTVVSLMGGGKYGPLLEQIGIPVFCLDMPQGRVTIAGLRKLRELLLAIGPDIVQTWMYHANLVGGLMAWLSGIRAIYWGIHHSNLEITESKWTTILVARFSALLTGLIPSRIVYCSAHAAEIHQQIGYLHTKGVVIPNGYALDHFEPDPAGRTRLRQEWGLDTHQPALGMVARFNRQKDHANLIAALGLLKHSGVTFQCFLIGPGVDDRNLSLQKEIRTHDLDDRVRMLGPRADIPQVMNALDLHVLSSSSGEAFPNVLAEAMACGTPCVTTEVGDAALIVGDTGWVVPPRDPDALASAIATAIDEFRDTTTWQARGAASRRRIEQHFSLQRMVDAYRHLWDDACLPSEQA